jgi:hypothetical protein
MNLRRIGLLAAMAILIAASAWPARTAEPKPRVTGIYSDLYYNLESGGLVGTEVFVVSAGSERYVAFVQCWQGGTTAAVVVPVQVDGDRIAFDVPPPSVGEGSYSGRISKAGFEGLWKHRLPNGKYAEAALHLRRKNSYWQ